ncbi:MAG: glycosyltransferase family 2 protein [Rhizobiales bacterium]|nr:glycosyltransferase family 2 protein [Hyphomicrobiales bacterium]
MDSIFVDIILPSYNNGTTIDETIASVVDQSVFERTVLHIQDDCSTDDTAECAQRWADRFTNVRFRRNRENVGVMSNYRILLSHCTASFVAPIEGDDVWISNTRVQQMVDYLAITGRAAVFSGFMIDDRMSGKVAPAPISGNRFRTLSVFEMLRGNPPASFSNCVYKRDALESAFSDALEASGYDWLVNTIIAHRDGGFDFYPEILSCYRVLSSGAWSSLSSADKGTLVSQTLQDLSRYLGPRYASALKAAHPADRGR